MQRAFYAILDDLRAAGRTIFFSSHVLSEVERVCDRVAIVRRGRLVALQDVASLLEHRKRNVEMRAADGDLPALEGVAGVSGDRAHGRRPADLPARGRRRAVPRRDRRPSDHRPDDRAGPSRGGVPRAVRGRRARATATRRRPASPRRRPVAAMNRVLFGHLWRSQRTKLLIVCVAMAAWSAFLPVIYQSFGSRCRRSSTPGSSRSSSRTSAAATSSACRRDRRSATSTRSRSSSSRSSRSGSRRRRSPASASGARSRCSSPGRCRAGTVYVTLLAAVARVHRARAGRGDASGRCSASAIAASLGELAIERLPLLWLNGMLLWGAFAAIGLAASVSFDRLTPALGADRRDRRRVVLPVRARLALAGREGPPAVLAVPLPDVARHPQRQRRRSAASRSWPWSARSRSAGPSWCSRGATSPRRAERLPERRDAVRRSRA